MWKFCRKQFRRLPLLGPVVDCSMKDLVETIYQTFIVLLLSTAPLWLGGLVIFIVSTQDSLTLLAALKQTVDHGQLFMYCTSLLAPMFWVALVDPPGARIFPSKIAHMVLIAVIELIASVCFGLTVAGNHLRQPFTFHLSVFIFTASLILLYLGTAYHSSRLPSPAEAFKRGEDDFSEAYEAHRG